MKSETNLLPQHFLDFITPYLPDGLSMQDFIDYSHKPLRKSIRVNTLKVSVADFLCAAKQKGWQLTPIPWCETGFWIDRPNEAEATQLGNTFEHLSGQFYIQEASSMLPPEALFESQTKCEMVLDIAAAPGSKTTQIAAKMNNQGFLLANEYSATRLKSLFANLQRCGVSNFALTNMDGRLLENLTEQFDAILLDAPCSGEGTVRKDPLSMRNWDETSVHDIAKTQLALIKAAFNALKVGGTLVYSTCTLNPFENQQICQQLKQAFPDSVIFDDLSNLFEGADKSITTEGFLHVWPQVYDSEGFFIARIKKQKSIEYQVDNPFKKLGKFPFEPINSKNKKALEQKLDHQFAFKGFKQGCLYQRNETIWYFPEGIEQLGGNIKLSRIGLKIAEVLRKGFKLHHDLAVHFGKNFSQQIIELSEQQTIEYLRGVDIRPETIEAEAGEVLLTYQGQALGFAKNLKNRLKNQLPRELAKSTLKQI